MDKILEKINYELELCSRNVGYTNTHSECLASGYQDGLEMVRKLIIADQAKRNCKNCIGLGKCAIYDSFNIEYCSDFEEDKRKQK